jgi:hypothetical protein
MHYETWLTRLRESRSVRNLLGLQHEFIESHIEVVRCALDLDPHLHLVRCCIVLGRNGDGNLDGTL